MIFAIVAIGMPGINKNKSFFGIPIAKVVAIWSHSQSKLEGILLRFGLNCN
jgi:hypothetical protein